MPTASATPIQLRLEIDAPANLKALLERYLDVSRLAQLSDADAPDEVEIQRLLAATPAQVRELLKTEGYFEPNIVLQRTAGAQLRVRLRVEPGVRVRVRQVAVRIQGPMADRLAAADRGASALSAGMASAGSLREGSPFRNPDWSQTKLAWVTRLQSAGYASATLIDSRAAVDVASAAAQLEAVLDSGPLFLAGPVQIEGLNYHASATVQNLAGFGPGRPLTETTLLDFQERLQRAGLFEAVTVTFDARAETAAATPVLVQLHELPLQQATVGVGTSDASGPRASIEHLHRRPFGWALTASHKLAWGRDVQRASSDWLTHPGPGFTRYLLGAQIDRERSDTDSVRSARLRLGRTQDTPNIERLAFVEWLASRQSVGDTTLNDAQALSANLHAVYRRLDNVLLPTRGFSLSMQLGAGQARSVQAESGPFARLQARLTGYLPLPGDWHAQARLEFGQVFKRAAVDVPDALGFRAGGDDSVRGYAHRSLAPQLTGHVVSGQVLLTASAELARPLSPNLPNVWGAVFVDAGRAAQTWGDYRAALGYGVGVRWRSPIGPLRADLAWGDELRKARLHLTAGVTF